MEGWYILAVIIIGLFLISWTSEKIGDYNRKEKQKQRDEIASNVIAESGINETNHEEVSEKYEYIVKNLVIHNADAEPYEILTSKVPPRRAGLQCPKCQAGYLVRRQGPYGSFLGCSRWPTCDSTKPVGWTNTRAKEAQKNHYVKKFLEDLKKAYG